LRGGRHDIDHAKDQTRHQSVKQRNVNRGEQEKRDRRARGNNSLVAHMNQCGARIHGRNGDSTTRRNMLSRNHSGGPAASNGEPEL